MGPRERPKDPNDPREYTAIPHEGWRCVGVLTIFVACVMGVVGLLHLVINVMPDGLERPTGVGWAAAIVPILIAIIALARGAFGALPWGTELFRSYWLRNVRGYRLACFLGHPLTGKQALLHSVIAPGTPVVDVAQPALLIPLGGWFPRTTIVAPEKEGYPWLWGSVQLRLRYPLRSLDDIGNRSVQITDRHGDRLTVTVQRALEIFEQHGVNVLTRGLDGWQSAFNLAFERSERFARERDAVQAQLTREGLASEHAHRMWRNTLSAIEDAIRRIKDSSRFGASLEALRIRISLLERFRALVPAPRPEEPQLRQWCTWAEEELEMARADLARRERHKGRPSAGAGV